MSDDNVPARGMPGREPDWVSMPPQSVQQPQPYGYGQQSSSVQPVGHGFAQTTVMRPRVGGVHITIAWIFAVFTLGYFLPWAVAATRQKSNTLAIGLVNFLVGWTVLGWIAALVMACLAEQGAVTNVAYAAAPVLQVGPGTPPGAGWYPDGTGLRRYWDGHRWTEHTAP